MAYRDRDEDDAGMKYSSRFDEYLYRRLVGNGLPALLRYEDKNSMAFSIEARVPFLDYRLVEYAFSLSPSQKIRDGVTQKIPYLLIVGDREAEAGSVSVRQRGEGDKGARPIQDLIDELTPQLSPPSS